MFNLDSVKGLADFLEVSPSTVRSWIRAGRISAEIHNGKYHIEEDANLDFITEKIRQRPFRRLHAYVPKEIANYGKWHTLLDEFCWLLKVSYSSRSDLKKKQFRLDEMFANYHARTADRIPKIARALGGASNRATLVTEDLRRGWYNELAFAFPLKSSLLGLSFSDIADNQEASAARFLFPSWRIISSYYAVYFFLRALAIQKEPAVNIQRHDQTVNAFKYNVIPRLDGSLWLFPFSIAWAPGQRSSIIGTPLSELSYLRYDYARHPRPPHRTPKESCRFVRNNFRNRARSRKKPAIYTILDLLRELRVWANYIDIDNLLNLWGPGYRTFLDQNLSTIVFFIGGIGEIGYLSVHGESKYMKEMQKFYERFVCRNDELESRFHQTPMYHRSLIYKELGLINRNIELAVRPDPNRVSTKITANKSLETNI